MYLPRQKSITHKKNPTPDAEAILHLGWKGGDVTDDSLGDALNHLVIVVRGLSRVRRSPDPLSFMLEAMSWVTRRNTRFSKRAELKHKI